MVFGIGIPPKIPAPLWVDVLDIPRQGSPSRLRIQDHDVVGIGPFVVARVLDKMGPKLAVDRLFDQSDGKAISLTASMKSDVQLAGRRSIGALRRNEDETLVRKKTVKDIHTSGHFGLIEDKKALLQPSAATVDLAILPAAAFYRRRIAAPVPHVNFDFFTRRVQRTAIDMRQDSRRRFDGSHTLL